MPKRHKLGWHILEPLNSLALKPTWYILHAQLMHCVLCEWHLWDTAPSFTWMVPLGAWQLGRMPATITTTHTSLMGIVIFMTITWPPSHHWLVWWCGPQNQMALIRELPFSKYEIDMRFHPQVGWDINKGSVGGSPEWYAMAQDRSPFPEWVHRPPPSPLLCWLLAFQSYPFSGQSPAASESSHFLPPTATEGQRASLKV